MFLLLRRDIMAKATYKGQIEFEGLMVPRFRVHDHHGGRHGSRQAGVVLELELRAHV